MKSAVRRILFNSVDSDVQKYINKLTGNGTSLNSIEIKALTTLVKSLKKGGIWDKYAFLWICPSQANLLSGAIYLKPYGNIDRMTLSNFALADFSTNGLIGNGSTSTADSGVLSTATSTNQLVGLGFYSHSNFADTSSAIQTSIQFLIYPRYSGGITYWDAGNSSGARTSALNSTAQGLGLYQVLGTNSTASRDKIELINATITPASEIAALNFTMWAGSARRFSMFFVLNMATLSIAERDIQYDVYTTYCNSIGRTL